MAKPRASRPGKRNRTELEMRMSPMAMLTVLSVYRKKGMALVWELELGSESV
jgi:hypothetical protein